MSLADHPTVKAYREGNISPPKPPAILDSTQLKKMALTAGAADAGFVDLARDAMADYRQDLLGAMPDTQSVMTLVFRVNQNHLKSLTHSVADYEFKQVWTDANHIARQLVIKLQQNGIKALNMPAGFPYEATQRPFPCGNISPSGPRPAATAAWQFARPEKRPSVNTWIKFLSKEVNLVKALLTRKIKIKGSPKLMMAFAKCFPS
jgi:hypothetical protein